MKILLGDGDYMIISRYKLYTIAEHFRYIIMASRTLMEVKAFESYKKPLERVELQGYTVIGLSNDKYTNKNIINEFYDEHGVYLVVGDETGCEIKKYRGGLKDYYYVDKTLYAECSTMEEALEFVEKVTN